MVSLEMAIVWSWEVMKDLNSIILFFWDFTGTSFGVVFDDLAGEGGYFFAKKFGDQFYYNMLDACCVVLVDFLPLKLLCTASALL